MLVVFMLCASNLMSSDEVYISVKSHGAVGNGTTDDTTAIQNALNTGDNVFFPSGTYLISQQISITKKGQIVSGANYYNTVIKAASTFSGDAVVLLDGSTTPAYRSGQQFKNIAVDGNSLTNGIKINKNADFALENCRFFNCDTGMYFIDTLLYVVNGCRIDSSNTGIYFYGCSTLSANNSVSFYNCKIFSNNVAISQRENTNIGGGIIFQKCEIEANGINLEAGDNRPTVFISGADQSQNMIAFKDCWFESNNNNTVIHFKLGKNNTVSIDNCKLLSTANMNDYMIYAEPLNSTYNGEGANINITNSYDASQYIVNTLKTTGKITVHALNYYCQSMDIANIDGSFIKRMGYDKFFTPIKFQNGNGTVYYSPAGTGYNKVYSATSNALFMESESGYIEIRPANNKYWGSSIATSYTRPFRIGYLWLWQNGNSLYMKHASAPTSANDGVVIGTAN